MKLMYNDHLVGEVKNIEQGIKLMNEDLKKKFIYQTGEITVKKYPDMIVLFNAAGVKSQYYLLKD